ncbi:MAG: HAD family hydrolase [Thiothrix sp.]|nr:MAG: HAD family hydrolase [Thiothrix sp.]
MHHSAELGPFDAFLFDMDGTILSSIKAAERVWANWAERYGLEVTRFLPTIHGRRAVDTIAGLKLPNIDSVAEAEIITLMEIADVAGIEPIAGAVEFLQALPPQRWAVVTSAPRSLALARMAAAGLPIPDCLVSADEVQHGKPAPDCFLLAAQRLGVAIENCLVFEDAPAGIQAAEAAGANLLVITATHTHKLATAQQAVANYKQLALTVTEQGLSLKFI